MRSGATLPAGSYLVVVYNENDTNPDFRINGPGISVSSGLNTAMGMGDAFPLGPYTFQAGSTYQIADANMPASAAITLTFGTGSGISNPSGGSTSSSSDGDVGLGVGRRLGRRQQLERVRGLVLVGLGRGEDARRPEGVASPSRVPER